MNVNTFYIVYSKVKLAFLLCIFCLFSFFNAKLIGLCGQINVQRHRNGG